MVGDVVSTKEKKPLRRFLPHAVGLSVALGVALFLLFPQDVTLPGYEVEIPSASAVRRPPGEGNALRLSADDGVDVTFRPRAPFRDVRTQCFVESKKDYRPWAMPLVVSKDGSVVAKGRSPELRQASAIICVLSTMDLDPREARKIAESKANTSHVRTIRIAIEAPETDRR